MFLRRLQEDGQRVFIDDEIMNKLDLMSRGEFLVNKRRFELACEQDIMEATEPEPKKIMKKKLILDQKQSQDIK
jgi:hypothetical protein